MDYFTYESFIHPDVLQAFLVKREAVTFNVVADAGIGSEYVNVDSVDNIYVGAIFLYENVEYRVRSIDTARKQIIINDLASALPNGTAVSILAVDYRGALKNFYEIGSKDCSTFTSSLVQSGVTVRFEADVYILKRAFIAMYSWILQNKAFLRDLNLTGLGIQKSDIYDHFNTLLNAERDELEAIRKEAMDEVARKQNAEYDGKSGKGFVRYTSPNRSYFSGYRR